MKLPRIFFALASLAVSLNAQDKASAGPTSEKAQRSYQEGLDYLRQRMTGSALDAFRKADKQDGGHCLACQKKIILYGQRVQDWKAAETAAEEMIGEAQTPKETAIAHYERGALLLTEGQVRHKEELFTRAHEELAKAADAFPNFADAILGDGRALAYLNQDDAAKARFEQYVKITPSDRPERQRVLLYINQPELARAAMAPPFEVTAIDGQHISLDALQGKVVLVDFWATWCPSCREALPHIKEIAKKFEGQPLVVLSISTDKDERAWKAFVAKNEMTWLQCRDAESQQSVAKAFGVQAIPQTFTIDADGVLQDQHIGDAAIEGKLKKLVKRAQEKQAQKSLTGEAQ